MDVVVQLGNKFKTLDDQLELLSRQLNLLQRFLTHKFQREFEEFVDAPEQFEASGSSDDQSPNVSIPADDGLPNSAETQEACGLQQTSSTNQQDGQCEDFEEEKFDPSGFVEPAEPQFSEFCYAQFVNALGLSNNDTNKVPSDLEPSTSRSFEDSNSFSVGTPAATIPSFSSNGSRRLQQKKRVEEECGENLLKRRSPLKLRKRRRNASEGERNPTTKVTDGTAVDDHLESGESGEDEEDLLASGRTSVDSSSSQDSESDWETMGSKIGVGMRKTRPARIERLGQQTPSGSSAVRPLKQNHPKEKRFKCSVCSKKFLSASRLRDHETIHTNEKPLKCSFCEKSFRRHGTLREHELIHTNEKPHECSYCEKSFRQAGTLRQHELIHTNEKPHECSVCHKFFRHATNLRRHKLIHSSEKQQKLNKPTENK